MTLTELSYHSRRLLPYLILLGLVLMIFFYAFKILWLYVDINKPKVTYSNPIFGKIKRPMINEATKSAHLNYILDTIDGQPVTASDTAKVFFLPPATTRFGYREKAYLMAKNLGFDTTVSKYQLVNNKEAVFDDGKQKLTIDIATFNFTYEYLLDKEKLDLNNVIIPGKTEIENKAINFLKTLDKYPEELSKGKINIVYLNYNQEKNNLFVTDNPEEANVVEVDFYRPNIEQYYVVTPKYYNSQNFLIMLFKNDTTKVVKAQIKFYEKSEEEFGVYPVKNGDAAWAELKSGSSSAMVISVAEGMQEVKIKEMFMAYLDQDSYQSYLQPVYVFLGENNFVAYVPAIDNNFLLE